MNPLIEINMLESILEIVNTVRQNRGKEKLVAIHNETHLKNDIGFDSLDLAELTVRIEAKYNIDIFENKIVNTIGEIIEILEEGKWISF